VSSSLPVPVGATASGFPSPADDHGEARIDLNVELIPRPLSTFLLRVSGEAMRGDGISEGDLLVIDRSVDAQPDMVVVAVHEGAFLLRRLCRRGDRPWLMAGDGVSPPIPLAPDPQGAELWGVVLHAVHVLPAPPTGQGR
jgi:DNA polymerase V